IGKEIGEAVYVLRHYENPPGPALSCTRARIPPDFGHTRDLLVHFQASRSFEVPHEAAGAVLHRLVELTPARPTHKCTLRHAMVEGRIEPRQDRGDGCSLEASEIPRCRNLADEINDRPCDRLRKISTMPYGRKPDCYVLADGL